MDARAELLKRFDSTYSPWVEIGQRIGPEALNVVFDVLGGTRPNVPMHDRFWVDLEREVRDSRICREFRGNNLLEVAERYQLSARQIRRIVQDRTNAKK